MIFSFPKFGSGMFAWIFLVPLLISLHGKNSTKAAALGFFAGLIGYTGILYWISHVVVQYGNLPLVFGICATLLLAGYLSLYIALFTAGVTFFEKRGLPLYLTAPPWWTLLEYVKSTVLTGFPWENLGHSQYQNLPIIQIAEITGVYGISFLLVLINALIAEVILAKNPKKSVKLILVGIIVITTTYVYGIWSIEFNDTRMEKAPTLHVSLIQGNVDQSVKWDPLYKKTTMGIYTTLTRRFAPPQGGLIVWPETAVPSFFQDRDEVHEQIVSLCRELKSWLLFGSPSYERKDDRLILFNSAYLLSPNDDRYMRYDKVHLVPYGEYVPLREYFPFIKKLVHGIGDFGRGKDYSPLSIDGIKLGVLICYEGIFPEASRKYKEKGTNILVNITNDAWFGWTSAPYQHLSMAIFRAVENRVYLLRAANTGISAIIDPTGRIISSSGLFETTGIEGSAKIMKNHTLYDRIGDLFVLMCFFALLGLFIYSTLRSKRYD
ncbi:MAG: apolipoprotein N-acyltransferase [Syntrophales bacterium]|nr:apolipoprotein N-acyltransferase [Syntrophales bacterium]